MKAQTKRKPRSKTIQVRVSEYEHNVILDAYYRAELHDGEVDKPFSEWLRIALLELAKA